MMPFVTDEIWRRLPLRSEDGAESLMVAAWPDPSALASWRDEDAEASITAVQEVVTAVRGVRARYTIAPRVLVDVAVKASGAAALVIENQQEIVRLLAGIGALRIDPEGAKPAHAAVAVAAGSEIYIMLEGIVDFAHERARVAGELEKAVVELERLTKKLANEGFLAKAAPEIVEKDRARAADLADSFGKLTSQLAELSE
jgi:valyl-tRNA synthetase